MDLFELVYFIILVLAFLALLTYYILDIKITILELNMLADKKINKIKNNIIKYYNSIDKLLGKNMDDDLKKLMKGINVLDDEDEIIENFKEFIESSTNILIKLEDSGVVLDKKESDKFMKNIDKSIKDYNDIAIRIMKYHNAFFSRFIVKKYKLKEYIYIVLDN